MPLFELLDILQKVQVQLQLAQGNDGQNVFMKSETVLNKNNGLKILKQILKILDGESVTMDSLPEDLATNDISFFKYAPITTVDVKRSFSIYTKISQLKIKDHLNSKTKKHLLL